VLSGLDRFRILVGWVIVAAWVVSLIVDVVIPEYAVPIALNSAMLLVAGYLFGPAITGRTRGKDDDA
jgi:hypothetical protein